MQHLPASLLAAGLLVLMGSSGCKKVINVNIHNVAPQMVITGVVTDQPGPYTVSISTTVNYTSDNVFPPVSGALVIITVNGLSDTLSETSAGTYTTHIIAGSPGNTYSLYVSTGGQVYTSSSTMPLKVPLDSVGYSNSGRSKKKINGVAYFQDPPGRANYYEFTEFNNGVQFQNNRGVSVFSDRLSDGKYISRTLEDDSTDINGGDTLMIQMNCIDVNVYNYLNTLNLITRENSFQSPTPDNPTGNISNKALGYFSANTVEKKSIFVP